VLQAIAFFLAYYTALSRISDYMHHWSDVLAGAINGTVIALLDVSLHTNTSCTVKITIYIVK